MKYDNILQTIGSTPSVRLQRIGANSGATLWVKLERANPGGSVKDRPAWNMIREGERSGALTPGKIGKLTIWTAKMNAATRPARGTVRSSSSVRDFHPHTPSVISAIAPNNTEVCALTMPSLICMARCWTVTTRAYSVI